MTFSVRDPFVSCTLDGASIGGVREVRVSRALGADCGVATITTDSPATFSLGGSVAVALGFDGSGAVCFSGFVARAEGAIPRGGALEARDRLETMRFPWGGSARVYSSRGSATFDAANIIRNVLEAYGIASAFASIQSDPLGDLGIIQPVRLNQGDVPLNLIREIDTNAGYATFTRGNGSVYRRPLELGSPSRTYREGVDIISARRVVTKDGIENRAVVTGLTYEGTAVGGTADLGNSDAPATPGYVARDITSNLIETEGAAGTAAARYVAVYGPTPDEVEFTVIGDEGVDVGDTIAVTSGSLGVAGARYFVVAVAHAVSAGGFTTTIRGRTF